MNPDKHNDDLAQQARNAFRTHLVGKARGARHKYHCHVDSNVITQMLNDRDVVRYPTEYQFDAEPLRASEFAYAHPVGFHPSDGYCLFVHPLFEDRPDTWPDLFAYHIPVINYGTIVEPDDAELYGATLLGLDVDIYYYRLCDYLAELKTSGHSHFAEPTMRRPATE